jgi:type IV secretion system protein VirB9
MNKLFIASLLCGLLSGAFAETVPEPGTGDARIRVVTYSPKNVVRLNTFFGVSTHIKFSDSEQIKDVAVGDDLAWKVIPRGNNLFIKPTAKEGDTNITVITNKRTYHFVAVVLNEKNQKAAWAHRDLIYSLSFRYNDEDDANSSARAKAEAEKARREDIKTRLARAPSRSGHNLDYWVAGHQEVSPSGAYDDGRFIYLTFNNNADMPAVYETDESGKESLVNTHVTSGNTIAIHRLAEKLTLRKGDFVASVWNKSYDSTGGANNLTGTVAPDVERVIKEVN